MPHPNKKRLRPLLLKLLNEESLKNEGLVWENKHSMTWRLPWKIKRKTSPKDNDGIVLKEIAKILWPLDMEDLSKCKERLRNALRSLDDFEQIEEQESYKVYRFLDERPRKLSKQKDRSEQPQPSFINDKNQFDNFNNIYDHSTFVTSAPLQHTIEDMPSITNNFRSRSPIGGTEDSFSNSASSWPSSGQSPNFSSDSQEAFSSSQNSCSMLQAADLSEFSDLIEFPIQNTICKFPNDTSDVNSCVVNQNPIFGEQSQNRVNNIPNFVTSNNTAFQIHSNKINHNNLVQCYETNNYSSGETKNCNIPSNGDTHFRDIEEMIAGEKVNINQKIVEPKPKSNSALTVQVYYAGYNVLDIPVQDDFCIYSNIAVYSIDNKKIELPNPETCDHLQENQRILISKILHQMNRGMLFSVKNNNLYVKRLCKCRIILDTPDDPEGKKLTRDDELLVFDYDNGFQESLKKYEQNQREKPKDFVKIGISAKVNGIFPITVLVYHIQAQKDLNDVANKICPTDSPECSKSDSYDKILDSLEKLAVGQTH